MVRNWLREWGGAWYKLDYFIHLRYLVSTYHVPGTVLGAEGSAVNKTDRNPYSHGAYMLVNRYPLAMLQ